MRMNQWANAISVRLYKADAGPSRPLTSGINYNVIAYSINYSHQILFTSNNLRLKARMRDTAPYKSACWHHKPSFVSNFCLNLSANICFLSCPLAFFYEGFWFPFRSAWLVFHASPGCICSLTGRCTFEAADTFIWGQWESISLSPIASPKAWTHFCQPPFGRREAAPGDTNFGVAWHWVVHIVLGTQT